MNSFQKAPLHRRIKRKEEKCTLLACRPGITKLCLRKGYSSVPSMVNSSDWSHFRSEHELCEMGRRDRVKKQDI